MIKILHLIAKEKQIYISIEKLHILSFLTLIGKSLGIEKRGQPNQIIMERK